MEEGIDMKRVLLFIGTNIAVLVVLSIVIKLLGVDQILYANGINYWNLLIFAAVFGFGGSFISLAMSKWMAKWSTGAQVIMQPRSDAEIWLVNTVQKQAAQAGIGMPDVAVFESPSPNAFATGMNKNNALVAVSTGLLRTMNRNEVEAVLGHEISHVANGDMVTLSLIQGVVNTFVIFISRVVGYFVDRVVLGNRVAREVHAWIKLHERNVEVPLFGQCVHGQFVFQRGKEAVAVGGVAAGLQHLGCQRALQFMALAQGFKNGHCAPSLQRTAHSTGALDGEHRKHHREHQEQHKQDFGNACGPGRYARKTQRPGHQGNQGKDDRVLEHGNVLRGWCGRQPAGCQEPSR